MLISGSQLSITVVKNFELKMFRLSLEPDRCHLSLFCDDKEARIEGYTHVVNGHGCMRGGEKMNENIF